MSKVQDNQHAYFFASDFCFFYIEKKLKVVSITIGLSTFT